MNKKSLALATIATIGLCTGALFAGVKYSYPVTINTTTRTVTGSLGTARSSSDAFQFIGCTVYASSTGFQQMQCGAMDSKAKQAICYSMDPAFIAMVGAIGPASYIYFTYDANANCTAVSVDNRSYDAPMK
jgi:hypothetical protein